MKQSHSDLSFDLKNRRKANQTMYLGWWQSLLFAHAYAIKAAISRITRIPGATFITIAVIGLALGRMQISEDASPE